MSMRRIQLETANTLDRCVCLPCRIFTLCQIADRQFKNYQTPYHRNVPQNLITLLDFQFVLLDPNFFVKLRVKKFREVAMFSFP